MPVPQNARSRFLTKHDAKRLISACSDKIRLVVQAALYTGMRRGELMKMEWSWVDLGYRMINIPGSATKTGRGRHVPISDEMLTVINEAGMKKAPGCQNVFHWEGKGLKPSQMEKYWRRARDSIGLEDFRFHDTRHAAASWMVMGGANLFTVGTILGHEDYKSTQRYAHLSPGHLREAMELVGLHRPALMKASLAEKQHHDAFALGIQFFQKGMTLRMVEEVTLRQALVACGHVQVKAARALGIARSTLRLKMEDYRIMTPRQAFLKTDDDSYPDHHMITQEPKPLRQFPEPRSDPRSSESLRRQKTSRSRKKSLGGRLIGSQSGRHGASAPYPVEKPHNTQLAGAGDNQNQG